MEGLMWLLIILNSIILWKVVGMRKRIEDLRRLQEKTQAAVEGLSRGHAAAAAPAPAEKPAPAPTLKPVVVPAPAMRPPAMPPPIPSAAAAATPIPAIQQPVAPGPTSKTAEAVNEILRKMWNWFLWNQETRPAGVSLEYAIASTWLLRIGILGVVAFVAFFLRWSYQQHLLGPGAQVGITILTGLGMLVGGMRLLGKKYHLIVQGLLGGGLLCLYFSVYAAGPSIHRLLPIEAVFGLMILVTVVAGFLAVRVDSLLIAVLGLAGGYLTPVLLRTPTPSLPGFYAYVLLLTAGTLAVAARKQWRLLHYLSFAFTYALFVGSLSVYKGKPEFPLAMSFLTAFFVLHSAMPALHNVLRCAASTALEIIHIVANAALYAALGYNLIADAWGRPYPALLSLGLAFFFAVHVGAFLWKRLQDRALLVCLLALAGAFTMWTLPLVMEKESLTICLALLAFVFLWMGRKIGSVFLQNLGHTLYLAVFVRLLMLDLPRNYAPWPDVRLHEAQYWKGMMERLWTFGISIGSVAAAFFVQRRDVPVNRRLAIAAATDIPDLVPRTWTAAAFFWFGILFTFLFAHLELNRLFGFWPSVRAPVLTALWCGMAGYFLWKYLEEEHSAVFFTAFCVFVLGALIKIFAFDVMLWGLTDAFIYRVDYTALLAVARLIDFGLPLLFLVTGFRLFAAHPEIRAASQVFGYGALALLFAYTSLELNSLLFWKLPEFRAGGISVLWALFGGSFITGGIWRSVRPLRYAGLLLCAVVVGKVLVDTKDMEMLYRFIAYLVLGVLLLLGSFAYIYSSRKFTIKETENRP